VAERRHRLFWRFVLTKTLDATLPPAERRVEDRHHTGAAVDCAGAAVASVGVGRVEVEEGGWERGNGLKENSFYRHLRACSDHADLYYRPRCTAKAPLSSRNPQAPLVSLFAQEPTGRLVLAPATERKDIVEVSLKQHSAC
jgi:hypothetical protein